MRSPNCPAQVGHVIELTMKDGTPVPVPVPTHPKQRRAKQRNGWKTQSPQLKKAISPPFLPPATSKILTPG